MRSTLMRNCAVRGELCRSRMTVCRSLRRGALHVRAWARGSGRIEAGPSHLPTQPSYTGPYDNSRGIEMTGDTSEPFPSTSGAVSEHIAARRLGVSLDMLRRDRRTGKLGIPFIKIGEGKRGLVRYDLADLERWVAEKKRVGRAPASQARPLVEEPPTADQQTMQPERQIEPRAQEPDVIGPP